RRTRCMCFPTLSTCCKIRGQVHKPPIVQSNNWGFMHLSPNFRGIMSYANPHLLWSVDELKSRLTDDKLVVMDMRPPEAYSNGHIPGARRFGFFGIRFVESGPEALDCLLLIIEHLNQAKSGNKRSPFFPFRDIGGMPTARLFWFLE